MKILNIISALLLLIPFYASAEMTDVVLQKATITNPSLKSFLTDTIVPIAKKNGFSLYKDCIEVVEYKDSEGIVSIFVTGEHTNKASTLDYLYRTDLKYVTFINNVPIFLIPGNKNSTWLSISDKKYNMGSVDPDKLNIAFCDSEAVWTFMIENQGMKCLNFQNEGLSWLESENLKDYIPVAFYETHFRIAKVADESRKLPVIDTTITYDRF